MKSDSATIEKYYKDLSKKALKKTKCLNEEKADLEEVTGDEALNDGKEEDIQSENESVDENTESDVFAYQLQII